MMPTDEGPRSWWVSEVREIDIDDAHPEGKTNIFMQWKGTDVCFDFHCECGQDGHFDGYFAYQVRCPNCGAIFAMPSTIYPLKLETPRTDMAEPITVVPDGDDDDEELCKCGHGDADHDSDGLCCGCGDRCTARMTFISLSWSGAPQDWPDPNAPWLGWG